VSIQIVPTVAWKIEGKEEKPLDPRLLPLLDAIHRKSSLATAVAECGISYRAAWGLLRDYREKFGTSLVTLKRGRGAELTALGSHLLRAHSTAIRRVERMRLRLSIDVDSDVSDAHLASSRDAA